MSNPKIMNARDLIRELLRADRTDADVSIQVFFPETGMEGHFMPLRVKIDNKNYDRETLVIVAEEE